MSNKTGVKKLIKVTDKLRNWILINFIPPFDLGSNEGSAFVVYSCHKSVRANEKLVCPLMDPIVLRKSNGDHTYITIDELDNEEQLPSIHLTRKVNIIQFILSILLLRTSDISNFRFISLLYESPMLCMGKGRGNWHELKYYRTYLAIRNFFLANYFSLKFRGLAMRCDKVYVLVYYNAMMLGLVSAFRKLGKEACDVQHGYLGPDHAAYNNTVAFSMPSSFKPTCFLVWDTRFGEYIDLLLGLPWENTNNHHMPVDILKVNKHTNQFKIMYSLQWGTSIPNGVLTAIKQHVHVQWVFRKHPFDYAERKDLNEILNFSNCTIGEVTESLADALNNCDLHLTFNSGVVHEAAFLGIPTIFMEKDFVVRASHEVSIGLAEYVSDISLSDAIEKHLAKSAPDFCGNQH